MNKKMKKWLPYILALFNIGSVIPLSRQTTFAAATESEQLANITNIYKTNWLDKFAEYKEVEEAGIKHKKWVLKEGKNAYQAFNEWTNAPKKEAGEDIAIKAVEKVAIHPYFGFYSGAPYSLSAVWSSEALEKCLYAIDNEIKRIVCKDINPLSLAANQIFGDVVPVATKYFAFGAVAYKVLGGVEKIADSFADRKFESWFSGKEQRAEDKRSEESVINLNWDFDSLPCNLISQELFETLVPMYPYAEEQINDYITTLIGIIKQKQKDPNAPTIIINVHGDPGCGKSTLIKLTMKILAKYNSINENAKALFITPSESQNNNDANMVDRCFGNYSVVVNGRRIKRESTFASCLKNNVNFITVLDDIDKLDTKESGGGVFKILWNIADGGLINGFPTSKVLFMSTANSDLTLQSSAVSGSQSSQAMLSRIKNIHFPNPDSAAYQKSFMSEIKKINDDESCKVSVSESVLKSIGEHCVRVSKGMREKNALIIKLRGLLVKADLNGWKNAEIRFSHDELSIVKAENKAPKTVISKKEPNVNKQDVEKVENIKNIAVIASSNVKLDEKTNNGKT